MPSTAEKDKPSIDILFPPPLWILADDQAELEIFPRIGEFLHWLGIPDAKLVYRRITARRGAIHDAKFLRVAWTDQPAEVEALLAKEPRAVVQIDLEWKGQEQPSAYGLRLIERLLQSPAISKESVFLLKSRVESAFGDEFRRRHVRYMRIFRSFFSPEGSQRIQFLGANLNAPQAAASYEAGRVAALLLDLQEELFFDLLREQHLGPKASRNCIEMVRTRKFFNAFGGNRRLEDRYVTETLEHYFEERVVSNVGGTPLALGPIRDAWLSHRSVRDPRKFFTGLGKESRALEIALMRYGRVAAIESLLFSLGEMDGFGEMRTLSRGALDQKWNPKKFPNVVVVELKLLVDAIARITDIFTAVDSSPSGQSQLTNCLAPFSSSRIGNLTLSHALLAVVELKGFLRNRCQGPAYDLLAPAIASLETILRPVRGLMLLPLSWPPPEDSAGHLRTERFPISEKVYVCLNRDRFLHNAPYAEKRFLAEGGAKSPSAFVSAFKIDSQCSVALRALAELGQRNPKGFQDVVDLLEHPKDGYVPLGLPQPDEIATLFRDDRDSSGLQDFAFFLRETNLRGRKPKGSTALLLELVVGGLHVLKYHVESFTRLLEWCVQGDPTVEENLGVMLASLWKERGWDHLFAPSIPEDVFDPLAGQWNVKGNLLNRLEATSRAGGHVSRRWQEFLARFAITPTRAAFGARFQETPPTWLRLYSLNLPLDFAPCLDSAGNGQVAIDDLHRQRDRLSVIALIRDQFRGDPYAFRDRMLELGELKQLKLAIKEPADPVNWENDEDFLLEAESAMEALIEESRE